MKEKLSLEKLEVKSFMTKSNHKKIVGGDIILEESNPICTLACHTDYCSPDAHSVMVCPTIFPDCPLEF